MAPQSELAKALDVYAAAVSKRAYWEQNGRRGDGNLERAKLVERLARAAVLKAGKA